MELDYGVSIILHWKACAAMNVITSGQNRVRVIIRRACRVATSWRHKNTGQRTSDVYPPGAGGEVFENSISCTIV